MNTGRPEAGAHYAALYNNAQHELAALRKELVRLKEVTNFKDAVACVFDNLKIVACNTRDRAWDDQLEDLAEDVIEMSPEYKKQWRDIGVLSASLTAAEQRNAALLEILRSLRLNASPRLFSAGQLALVDAALSTESAVIEIDERAEFEAEMLRQNPEADLERNPTGNYMNFYLECAWNGWQQRAALLGNAQPTESGASE